MFVRRAALLVVVVGLPGLCAVLDSGCLNAPAAARPRASLPQLVADRNAPDSDTARSFAAQDDETAIVPGFPATRFFSNSEQDFRRALPPNRASAPWLALSAGGADGAFSAGLLSGWSAEGTRPEFALVTGVSAGALVAPYAFLGSRYDDRLRQILATITDADVFEAKRTSTSLVDTWPFRDLLKKQITPQLLADVAAEHRRGRRLFIITTDLDAGRTMVWNMGKIAAHGDAALALFRDVLLASASLPGVFPPVLIDAEAHGRRFQEMHADGGMGGPFFIGPESWLTGATQARLPTRQIYLIVNGTLAPEFDLTPSTTIGVLGRAFSTAVKTGMRLEIAAVASASKPDAIDFEVAHISDSFSHPSHGLFDPDYVNALYDFGYRQAQQAFSPPMKISQQPSQ